MTSPRDMREPTNEVRGKRPARFEAAWREFVKLKGPEQDWLAMDEVWKLVDAVTLEIQLVAEGEQEHARKEMAAMRAFIKKWSA